MWRKIMLGVVGAAFVGSAIVLAQGLQPGPRRQSPGSQQRGQREGAGNRRQQMERLRRAVRRAPREMTAHKGSIYMVKQGMLLQLDSNLNIQKSVKLPGEVMIRPQLTAQGSRIYLSGIRQLLVFNTKLEQTNSKRLSEITPETQQGGQGSVSGQQQSRGRRSLSSGQSR